MSTQNPNEPPLRNFNRILIGYIVLVVIFLICLIIGLDWAKEPNKLETELPFNSLFLGVRSEPIDYLQITKDSLIGQAPPFLVKGEVIASLMDSNWLISALAECESGRNPDAYNEKDPHGGSFGLLQFQKPTFQRFCVEKYGLLNDIWDYEIQIECAEKMIDEGLINHWTCGKKIFDN